MQSYVAGFMFSKDFLQVALIRKQKPKWMNGLLNGIGGKVEHNEFSYVAMIREFEEEAGIKVGSWIHFVTLVGKDYKVDFYKTTGDLSKLISMEDEKIEIINVSDLPNHSIVSNLSWVISIALDPEVSMAIVNTFVN